jgi:hypothetical protein
MNIVLFLKQLIDAIPTDELEEIVVRVEDRNGNVLDLEIEEVGGWSGIKGARTIECVRMDAVLQK